MKTLPNSYPLYDSVYGTEIPTEQYYVILFNTLPSKHLNNLSYDDSINKFLLEQGFEEDCDVFTKNRRSESTQQTLYVHRNKKIFIRTYKGSDVLKNSLSQIEILYDIKLGKLENQIDFDELKKLERKRKKSNINLVKSDMGHLDIEQYDLPIPPINLELNYGSEFQKLHDVIIKKLNEENGKGIILLHGDPGTGKTSYIKFLTSLITDKEILFIPPSMAEMLSEPSIIPFLMEHKNSILIIEDAERVIGDREGNGSPAGVSNILNLTDGILGDCLSIQIVATFNMKRERIDKALLRKGRLIAEHKFEKLTVEETNNLLKHLGKEEISSEPMCLADIYNIDVELHKTSDKINKIGF